MYLRKCFLLLRERLCGEQGSETPLLGLGGILNDVDETAPMTMERGVGHRKRGISSSVSAYSPRT